MGEGDHGNRTYADFLRLHELLELQSEERGINSDEMHFIIVHQTFELWFKQVIRELSEARDILGQAPVPEDDIPRAVDTSVERLRSSALWPISGRSSRP